MTQAGLAGDKYDKSYISQVESGRFWPSLPAMIYIAKRLRKPIDWFIPDDDFNGTSVLEDLAAELDVNPARLKAALQRLVSRR